MPEKYVVVLLSYQKCVNNWEFLNERKPLHLKVIVRKEWLFLKLEEPRAGLGRFQPNALSKSANPVPPRLNKQSC